MLRDILTTTNGSKLSFGSGKFDDWCIYVHLAGEPENNYFFPLDSWYFAELARIDATEPGIYDDFVDIYERTDTEVDESIIDLIKELSDKYTEKDLIELIYSILYAGMIAEENKENTMLGKRIKRLGMFQTLVEKLDPTYAANFSRGMKWYEIDEECHKRGF